MSHLKFLQSFEREDKYAFINMPIDSLRQLVKELDQIQILSFFFIYESHMMSLEHSGDSCDVIFGKKILDSYRNHAQIFHMIPKTKNLFTPYTLAL